MDIPGYRIIQELGRGGMATVYLAEQEKFGREVALKVMAANLGEDKSFQTRFIREARNLAQTSHPNIVTVYDVDVHDNHHYFSMEYHTGGDLSARLKEGISPREALRITREMASALARAHECGIIHRDIKPGNIMFARDGRAILTDFGIARNYDGETQLTQMGSMIGTPRYMSPEQACGQPLQNPSDIYSLGVVLFEMLAGVPPYQAADSIALGIKHVSAPIPDLPPELAEFQPLVERLMAKEATDRPQSGQALIELLDEFESGLSNSDKYTVKALKKRQSDDEATQALKKRQSDDEATVVTGASGKARSKKLPLIAGGVGVVVVAAAGALFVQDGGETVIAPTSPPETTTETGIAATEASQNEQIAQWLQRGDEALLDDRLMTPPENSAVHWYRKVLALQPDDSQARNGLQQVAQRYVTLARAKLAQRDTKTARVYVNRARSVDPDLPELAELDAQLSQASTAKQERQQSISDLGTQLRISGLLGSARSAEEEGDLAQARAHYREVLSLDSSNTDAKAGLARLKQ